MFRQYYYLYKAHKGVPRIFDICRNKRQISNDPHNSHASQKDGIDKDKEAKVVVEKDVNITLIGLNREASRNSIDVETCNELSAAIRAFEEDADSPVGVLYGIGGSFCAGYDVRELETQLNAQNINFLAQTEGSVGPTRRLHLRKPLICGISGFCVAAGLELALLCDLRVMEETAVIGFFNRHLGVPITDAGTARLSMIVGYSKALELILSGRRVDGKEALGMGLINRLVATGSALGQAVHLAFNIAKYPMAALQHDRSCLYQNVFEAGNFQSAIRNETLLMNNDILKEMKEGAGKFTKSAYKGAKVDTFINKKVIPDWEKAEIAIEEKYSETRKKIA